MLSFENLCFSILGMAANRSKHWQVSAVCLIKGTQDGMISHPTWALFPSRGGTGPPPPRVPSPPPPPNLTPAPPGGGGGDITERIGYLFEGSLPQLSYPVSHSICILEVFLPCQIHASSQLKTRTLWVKPLLLGGMPPSTNRC